MNKLTKHTLLTAGALCVVGGILFAIGTGLGGMHFLSTADLSALESPNSSTKLYKMDKIELDDFSRLEANVTYMDISILPSEDNLCYLSYNITGSSEKNPFEYTIQNGTLSLKENHSGESQFFVGIDYRFLAQLFTGRIITDGTDNASDSMTLYLPEDKYLECTSISNSDGDIALHGLKTEQLTLESSYGDISVNNCSLGTATFQSSDGDFSSENTTYTGDCAFNLSYGDIIFRLDDSQKEALSMDLKTNYGDISIAENLPNSAYTQYGDEDTKSYQKTGTANGGTLSVYCDDGDITIK